MRSILALVTVLMLAGIGSGVAVNDAAELPKFEASKVTSELVENIGWRRDSRRHGYVAIAPRGAIIDVHLSWPSPKIPLLSSSCWEAAESSSSGTAPLASISGIWNGIFIEPNR